MKKNHRNSKPKVSRKGRNQNPPNNETNSVKEEHTSNSSKKCPWFNLWAGFVIVFLIASVFFFIKSIGKNEPEKSENETILSSIVSKGYAVLDYNGESLIVSREDTVCRTTSHMVLGVDTLPWIDSLWESIKSNEICDDIIIKDDSVLEKSVRLKNEIQSKVEGDTVFPVYAIRINDSSLWVSFTEESLGEKISIWELYNDTCVWTTDSLENTKGVISIAVSKGNLDSCSCFCLVSNNHISSCFTVGGFLHEQVLSQNDNKKTFPWSILFWVFLAACLMFILLWYMSLIRMDLVRGPGFLKNDKGKNVPTGNNGLGNQNSESMEPKDIVGTQNDNTNSNIETDNNGIIETDFESIKNKLKKMIEGNDEFKKFFQQSCNVDESNDESNISDAELEELGKRKDCLMDAVFEAIKPYLEKNIYCEEDIKSRVESAVAQERERIMAKQNDLSDEIKKQYEETINIISGQLQDEKKKVNGMKDDYEKEKEKLKNDYEKEKEKLKDAHDQSQKALTKEKEKLEAEKSVHSEDLQKLSDAKKNIERLESSLKRYNTTMADTTPAKEYGSLLIQLVALGDDVEKAAVALLNNDALGDDNYLVERYIARYRGKLSEINDRTSLVTDAMNIGKCQFVYKDRPVANYRIDDSAYLGHVKEYFYQWYLKKYIDSLVVLNESMAGMQYLSAGVTAQMAAPFLNYRKMIDELTAKMGIVVEYVKVCDSSIDNTSLSVTPRDLDYNFPSGTVCQIDNAIVYPVGGIRPNEKISVITKQ